jgi:hypothetical protein
MFKRLLSSPLQTQSYHGGMGEMSSGWGVAAKTCVVLNCAKYIGQNTCSSQQGRPFQPTLG